MRYREVSPPPALAPHLRCLWLLEHEGPDQQQDQEPERILPDGTVEIVVHYGALMLRQLDDGSYERQGRSVVAGQMRSATHLISTGPTGMVAARFEPWAAAPFLGEALAGLTSQIVPLDALWGREARQLEERIAEAADDTTRFALLCNALYARIQSLDDTSHALRQAVQWITEARGVLPVRELSQRLSWSPRRLERQFAARVGLSAKALCRIERFQHVVQRLGPASSELQKPDAGLVAPPLAQLALEAGYADQAHLARDFRQLAGLSATQYRAEQHALSDCFTAG